MISGHILASVSSLLIIGAQGAYLWQIRDLVTRRIDRDAILSGSTRSKRIKTPQIADSASGPRVPRYSNSMDLEEPHASELGDGLRKRLFAGNRLAVKVKRGVGTHGSARIGQVQ